MTSPPPSIHLQWTPGTTSISWTYGHVHVRKDYPLPPQTALAWADPPCIIVVEAQPDSHPRLDNAVVLNLDGTERLRLRPPRVSTEPSWDIGFYAVYPEPTGLVAVFATRVGDFWGRPDLTNGELTNVTQWR
jgi:hypothetical protein